MSVTIPSSLATYTAMHACLQCSLFCKQPNLPKLTVLVYAVQLGYRFAHILRRMLPIAMYLLQRDSQFLNGHDLFLKRVGASYHAFIEEAEKVCRGKCQEDLQSTTRYVTWSLHTKSRSSLKAMLSKVRHTVQSSCKGGLQARLYDAKHFSMPGLEALLPKIGPNKQR